MKWLAPMVLIAALPAAANAAPDPAHGFWMTENKKAIVRIAPCGSETCGQMVWVANPLNAEGKPKLDLNNPDQSKKARTICGLPLIGGFRSQGSGVWKKGWIYNPRDGETYSAQLEAVSETKLKVRGYLLLPALGKTQTWTRVDDDRGGCNG